MKINTVWSNFFLVETCFQPSSSADTGTHSISIKIGHLDRIQDAIEALCPGFKITLSQATAHLAQAPTSEESQYPQEDEPQAAAAEGSNPLTALERIQSFMKDKLSSSQLRSFKRSYGGLLEAVRAMLTGKDTSTASDDSPTAASRQLVLCRETVDLLREIFIRVMEEFHSSQVSNELMIILLSLFHTQIGSLDVFR